MTVTTTISGTIENTGNIRVRPEGTLTLTDANGAQVVDAPIAMESVYAGDHNQPLRSFFQHRYPKGLYRQCRSQRP